MIESTLSASLPPSPPTPATSWERMASSMYLALNPGLIKARSWSSFRVNIVAGRQANSCGVRKVNRSNTYIYWNIGEIIENVGLLIIILMMMMMKKTIIKVRIIILLI